MGGHHIRDIEKKVRREKDDNVSMCDLLPSSLSEGSNFSAERFDGSASSPVRSMVSDFSRPFPTWCPPFNCQAAVKVEGKEKKGEEKNKVRKSEIQKAETAEESRCGA